MNDLQHLLSQLRRNRISRRQFMQRAGALGVSASAAAAMAGVLPARSAAAHAAAQDREPTTVTIWTWREPDIAVWEAAAEALQETWPGLAVEVDASESTEFPARVATAMQGGQGPDIITTRAGDGYFQPYADADMFVPLTTDLVPALADIPEGTLGQVSYQGEVLAVPFASQIWMFYYNTAIFEENGLTPPETWDDLVGILETLRETDVAPMFVPAREGWVLSGMVDCIGATVLGDDYAAQLISGEARFTDEPFIALLDRIHALVPFFQEGFVGNDTADMDGAFQTGQAAMILYGGWAAKGYAELAPDLEFDFFLAPPDEAGGPQASYVFVDGGYAVNAASEVQEAAMELVRYSATVEYGQTFSDLTQEMSSIPGVTAPDENIFLQRQLTYSEQAIQNLFRIRSPFDVGNPGISTLLHPLMQGLLSDQITSEEVAQQLDEGLSQWYEPFQS